MSKVFIYALTIRGKIMYVGQSINITKRMRQHQRAARTGVGGMKKLYDVLSAIPGRDWDMVALDSCAQEDAKALETHFIKLYRTAETGLNTTPHGFGGRQAGCQNPSGSDHYSYGRSPVFAVAASVASRTGRNLTPEHVEKIRKGNSKVDRKDCRQVVRDDGVEYASVGRAAKDLGVTSAAISMSLSKGYKAAGHNFRYAHAEMKINVDKTNAKAIRCLKTGTVYASAKAASEALGLSRGNLSQHLQGINKTCKGHTFEFVTGSE